jgi:hypothetical protein
MSFDVAKRNCGLAAAPGHEFDGDERAATATGGLSACSRSSM